MYKEKFIKIVNIKMKKKKLIKNMMKNKDEKYYSNF